MQESVINCCLIFQIKHRSNIIYSMNERLKLLAGKFEDHINAGILDLLDEAAYLSDEK